jgi:hypothetical protein
MARILCTQKLLNALDIPSPPARTAGQRRLRGIRLGSWAATRRRFGGRDLVLALEQRTYLTVVFPLWPRAGFRARFADALAAALADLDVPEDLATPERGAIDAAPLALLGDRTLVRSLDDVEFICGIELMYHDDLRRVQRNLNDFPHPRRDPCVPVAAVARLFSAAGPRPSRSIH